MSSCKVSAVLQHFDFFNTASIPTELEYLETMLFCKVGFKVSFIKIELSIWAELSAKKINLIEADLVIDKLPVSTNILISDS